MVAFDSCVLIYVLENNPKFADRARRVFLDIERKGGVCSSLVVAESLYGNIRTIDQLGPLLSPAIKIVSLDAKIAEQAGLLRLEHGLKMADAVHIATALAAGATTFITNDLNIRKKQLGVNVVGL